MSSEQHDKTCAWCKEKMKEKAPTPDSHGICEECLKKVFEDEMSNEGNTI